MSVSHSIVASCRMRLLTYADKDGKRVHVDDVPSGNQCGCTCPMCGQPLIARNQGQKMMHHFAHPSQPHDVKSNGETALHKLAKQIIADNKAVMLPAYYQYSRSQLFYFDAVEVEERNDYELLQPDCVGIKYVNDTPHRLWIEIKVTHGIDERKSNEIHRLCQPCIEIDMERFRNRPYTESEVVEFLLCSTESRYWIYSPYESQYLQSVQKEQERQIALGQTWLQQHPECHSVDKQQCEHCPMHTFRDSLHELLRQSPVTAANPTLQAEIMSLGLSQLQKPFVTRKQNNHSVLRVGHYTLVLNNLKRSTYERNLYYFFGTYLPDFCRKALSKCKFRKRVLWSNNIACSCSLLYNTKSV